MGQVSTVINHNTGTITPTAVSGWESAAEAQTIVHHIIGRPDPDITMRPASLREGTLTLVFESPAAATAARAVLVFPQVLTLASTDVAQVGMSFVVANGSVGDVLGDAGEWTLALPFHEVTV